MEDRRRSEAKPRIRSFHDLEVYNNSYNDAIIIINDVIPRLPSEEKFNLADQLRRSCMAIPTLIAEGYAKKHLKRAFSKYLDDANGECNEVIVHLSFCRDVHGGELDKKLLETLISNYDKYARQIYRLSAAWRKFNSNSNL